MTADELIQAATKYRQDRPEQRWGQAPFNTVYDLNPEFASEVTATELNPFYDDARVEALLMALETRHAPDHS